jgi:proteasome lid subunit RPN8/RPN11
MILSCVEIFKREALGYLIGYKTPELFIVEHAIPFQTAKRGYVWAEVPEKRLERVRELAERFRTHFDIIGDFHSHAQLGDSPGTPEPSGDDIASMEKGKVYLIVAINKCGEEECLKWHNTETLTLKGSIRGYIIEIAAFELQGKTKCVKIPVYAPFATGI